MANPARQLTTVRPDSGLPALPRSGSCCQGDATMFVRDINSVGRPFQIVAPRFLGRELPVDALARGAVADAYSLTSERWHPASGLAGLRCSRGVLRSRGDAIVVPLLWFNPWHAVGPASLAGELAVAPRGARTELGVEASYQDAGSGLLATECTRRVTELAVREFLRALCRTLDA